MTNYDQSLNTTDDVQFASVSFPDSAARVATAGHIRAGYDFSIYGRYTPADTIQDRRLFDYLNNNITIGQPGIGQILSYGQSFEFLASDGGAYLYLGLGLTEIGGTNVPIYLSPGEATLNINGVPGHTEEIVIPNVGTLSVTKGLITGWTPA